LIGPQTRLLACALASNALGSTVDVQRAAQLLHAAGGEIFLDAVHYAPHGPIDVQALECDYLVCSGYKIFAPHMGSLWGRHELLAAVPTFREDFIPDEPPGKIEAGTFIYENVAGMAAAVDYLADLGVRLSGGPLDVSAACHFAMARIRGYEQHLSLELLRALKDAGAKVYGLSDAAQVARRVPTVCFNLPDVPPAAVCEAAAAAGI